MVHRQQHDSPSEDEDRLLSVAVASQTLKNAVLYKISREEILSRKSNAVRPLSKWLVVISAWSHTRPKVSFRETKVLNGV